MTSRLDWCKRIKKEIPEKGRIIRFVYLNRFWIESLSKGVKERHRNALSRGGNTNKGHLKIISMIILWLREESARFVYLKKKKWLEMTQTKQFLMMLYWNWKK